MKSSRSPRWPMVLGISAGLLLIAIPVLLFLVWQIATYGCWPGFSAPAVSARDVAALNAVLVWTRLLQAYTQRQCTAMR
jgi:hypothetical protein